jgi:hypothetical protein
MRSVPPGIRTSKVARTPERRCNPPLAFKLKPIEVDHPLVAMPGISRETLQTFGAGYFAGKGILHDRMVIPFHDADGFLVAYAGYAPADGSIAYPRRFDRSLELFNAFRAEREGLFMDGIVLVTDLLNVLRLHEIGLRRVVAIPTATLCQPQLETIARLVGTHGTVDFVPWTKAYDHMLERLLDRFHVRLHRYYDGSEDEFLSQVATAVAW